MRSWIAPSVGANWPPMVECAGDIKAYRSGYSCSGSVSVVAGEVYSGVLGIEGDVEGCVEGIGEFGQ